MAQGLHTTEKGEQVVFRRVRGRVVPIKVKKPTVGKTKTKETAKGAGLFGAGLIGGLFGGSTYAEFGAESERARKVSQDLWKKNIKIKAQEKYLRSKTRAAGKTTAVFSERTGIFAYDVDFLKKQSKTYRKAAARQRLRAKTLSKLGFGIGTGAILGGTYLAAVGARTMFEAHKGERASLGEEAFTDLGTTLVVGAAAKEFGTKRNIGFRSARFALKKILTRGKL